MQPCQEFLRELCLLEMFVGLGLGHGRVVGQPHLGLRIRESKIATTSMVKEIGAVFIGG
jgi:hypothetical protein